MYRDYVGKLICSETWHTSSGIERPVCSELKHTPSCVKGASLYWKEFESTFVLESVQDCINSKLPFVLIASQGVISNVSLRLMSVHIASYTSGIFPHRGEPLFLC